MRHPRLALIVTSALALAALGAQAQTSPGAPASGATGPSASPAPRPLTPTPAPGGSAVKPTLQALDKNHDGKVTREEASAAPDLARDFARLDKNHDGKLDAAEFAGYMGGAPMSGPRSSAN